MGTDSGGRSWGACPRCLQSMPAHADAGRQEVMCCTCVLGYADAKKHSPGHLLDTVLMPSKRAETSSTLGGARAHQAHEYALYAQGAQSKPIRRDMWPAKPQDAPCHASAESRHHRARCSASILWSAIVGAKERRIAVWVVGAPCNRSAFARRIQGIPGYPHMQGATRREATQCRHTQRPRPAGRGLRRTTAPRAHCRPARRGHCWERPGCTLTIGPSARAALT